MTASTLPMVFGKDGFLGWLETPLAGTEALPHLVALRLEDGRQIQVPKALLSAQADGSFLLPFTLEVLEREYGRREEDENQTLTMPLIAEELQVGKRTVETGRVRFHTTVQEHEEVVDEPLLREEVTVVRVPIHRLCEGPAPEVRQEGNLTIIPVLEEVLIVEKRLMLKEEIHVRREQSTFHDPQRVLLRQEEVQVERVATPNVEGA